jgi:AraC-like DNA-binding protein
MRTEAEVKKYYTIDSASAEHFRTVRSFEKDADMPIAFVHYKHRAHAQNGQSFKRKNDFSTVFVFVRGGVGFLFGETLYSPNFGEAVLIGEQIPFSVFGAGDQFDYYEIDFPHGFLDRICEDSPFATLFSDRGRSPIISLGREKKEEILSLLQSAEDAESDLLAYSYLIRLAHLLCHGTASEAKKKRIPKTLSAAIEFMSLHRAEIVGAEDVASHCGVSTTYLARLFRDTLSCTTTEYLNRLRIAHAKELLLAGRSATEACYASGFNSYTYFITKFKEETGVTPARYR